MHSGVLASLQQFNLNYNQDDRPFSALTLLVGRRERYPACQSPAVHVLCICLWRGFKNPTSSRDLHLFYTSDPKRDVSYTPNGEYYRHI